MKIEWNTVVGSQEKKPEIIDKSSSNIYVYLHKNIISINKTNESDPPITLWQYDEAIITQEDYTSLYGDFISELISEQLNVLETSQERKNIEIQANIEYIAMMTNIDLEG